MVMGARTIDMRGEKLVRLGWRAMTYTPGLTAIALAAQRFAS